MWLDRIIKRIAERGPIDAPADIFNYGARDNFGIISPIQSRAELVPVLEIVRTARPRTVMEIGTANGGTLFMLTSDADIISLDLPEGDWDGGYAERRIPLYQAFALPGQKMHLLREDLHQQSSLDAVKAILAGRTVDFLFIDGDHSYDGVRMDYEMYAPLVTPGGMIGFHDIVYTEGVTRQWTAVKAKYPSAREFVAPAEPIRHRIGDDACLLKPRHSGSDVAVLTVVGAAGPARAAVAAGRVLDVLAPAGRGGAYLLDRVGRTGGG